MGITLKGIFRFFIFLLAIGQVIELRSQDIKMDSALYERDGRQFYRYVVQAGNTLYSISKKFDVSVQEIQEHNPSSSNGLSIGDTLYIIAVEVDAEAIQQKMEVDGNYIVHEVQKGQTLYAISKMYGIKVSEILEVNLELKDGVKEGQVIRIPVARLKKQELEAETRPLEEKVQLTHKVEAKETLYSLSRRYSVSIDQLKQANGGLPAGLQVGQELIIPGSLVDSFLPVDSTIIKDRYKVALILPFFLDLNDSLVVNLKVNEKETVLSKSNVAIQFYEGSLMALDSLKKLGFKFDVTIYDSGKDSNIVNSLINEGKLKDVDLIIGPFYQSQFLRVSQYAKQEKIHIVSPVPLSNKILLGNPYASKVATSQNVLFKNLGEYVQKNYGSENIVVVTQNFRANAMAHAFEKSYLEHSPAERDSSKKGIREVKWDSGSIDGIKSILKDSVFNIIVIPSNDQVYVTELLSKLNQLNRDYLFKVIGTENWLRYSNLDADYLENLHVTIPIDAYVNYQDKATLKFIQSFQKRFEVFPENFSFLGFDVTFFFLKLLQENGTRIEPALEEKSERYFYRQFNFFKTGIESGYENSSLRILEHRDFEVRELR